MDLQYITNYQDLRFNLLKKTEWESLWAYSDSVGIATIGIGLNLQEHGELVLQTLGFDLAGTQLKGTALAAERDYADEILFIIRNRKPGSDPSFL